MLTQPALRALLLPTLFTLACTTSTGSVAEAPPVTETSASAEAPPVVEAPPVTEAPPTAEEPLAAGSEPTEVPPPKENDGQSSEQDWLRVGAATDGATLTSAEVAKGPAANSATVTFSFEGKGAPPATRARLENPRLIVLVIEGVRDMKANLPLVTGEGFRVIGKPRPINQSPVKSMGRGFIGDDSSIRVDIELSAQVTLELVQGAQGRTVELRVSPTK